MERHHASTLLSALLALTASGLAYAQSAGQAFLQDEIYRSRVVTEPLLPFGATSFSEDDALLAAVRRYDGDGHQDDLNPLKEFLVKYPQSNWRVAILVNEGLASYREGYFERAIDSFSEAWRLGKLVNEPRQKALVDRAVAELIEMHARLGHADVLADLLKEVEHRPIEGRAAGIIEGAKEGLFEMQHNPGIAYLCGPMAVKNILLTLQPGSVKTGLLDAYRSGPHGVDFATVERLAGKVGLQYRKARIANPGTQLPLPAIVHWRVNHYAAVVAFVEGRYEVKDPTFGQESLWITPQALVAESDGYYLIPKRAQGLELAQVSAAEAKAVFGMGFTASSDNGATTTSDENTCCNGQGAGKGMPVADAKALLASLNLTDTPLSYSPPKGPEMNVTVIYNHLDVTQPANFTYSSVGRQWGMNWIAFIVDNPTNASASVSRVFGGGGYVVDGGCSAWDCQFIREALTGDILSRVKQLDGTVIYTLTDRVGGQQVYAQSDGATSGSRRVFLTKLIDPQGNAVTVNYDSQMRLSSVVDALGRPVTFSYGDSAYPYNITEADDSFGRSVSFTYDNSGRLIAIKDAIGLNSTFSYNDPSHATFVSSMTTPYGTSNYSYQSGTSAGGDYRLLTLTDPNGYTQKVEYYIGGPQTGVPFSDPPAQVPIGTTPALANQYLYYRNTFYWNAQAYQQDPNNYGIAKTYHFLHNINNTNQTSRSVESIKLPLQNRVTYTYPGMSSGSLFTGVLYNDPTDVAFVVNNNGSRASSVTHREYNAQTNVTCFRDPAGRITKYDYAANGIDVLKVRQGRSGASCSTTSGIYDVVAQYTYNGQHEPLTYTDAANQTTNYAYDAAGQVTSVTNALGEITTYHRDANSYLLSVSGPHGEALASFTYDPVGRTSTQTDAGGETIAYSWDDLNRLITIAYPDGTSRTLGYDRLDVVSVTDRLGRMTHYGYDANRNQTSMTDPLNKTTTFSYDGNNRLVGMLDANNHQTTWRRDIQARTTARIYPDLSSETYVYAPETGWLSSNTDQLGQISEHGYTADGRISTIAYSSALTPTPSVSFAYDPSYPRTTTMVDGTGTTTYSYYPVGVLGANEIQSVQNPRPAAQLAYAYDALARIASRSIDGKTESIAYDDLGRVTNDQNSLSSFTYGYLGATDQVTSVTTSDSPFKVSYEYLDNTNDRRLKTIANGTHGKSLQKFDYTTNAENQALSESSHDGYAVNYQFGYDADNRLSTADAKGNGAPRHLGYTFDALGNLQQIATTDHTPSIQFQATYDALNRIDQANGVAFTYDAAGELIEDGAHHYTWDAVHRLVGVMDNHSGNLTSYIYDGLGRRVAIVVQSPSSSIATNYLWCDAEICQARDMTNAVAGEFFDQGESQGGSKLLYARDRLGSVTDLVDAPSGNITASFAYDPWGNVTNTSGTLTPTFGFAGMFADRSTGKNLTLFRAYDPLTARWISEDPIGLAGGLNGYAYSGGSPINYTDPLGLMWGDSYGDSAVDYWADMEARTGNHWYAMPGMLAEMWTPCHSLDTALTLIPAGMMGRGLAWLGKAKLGMRAKGKLGELLSIANNKLKGSTLISRNRMSIPGLRTIVDSTWRDVTGRIYYVEAKFGTATLSKLQRQAASQLGDLYEVERWSYDFVRNFGATISAGLGAAAGSVSNPCGCE